MPEDTEVTAGLPPSLKENIDELKAEGAQAVEASGEVVTPKKRGRPKGSKNAPKDKEQVPQLPDFPLESLALLHTGIWNAISNRLRSDYKLSEQGAQDMALWANQVLKQYLSPYLAQHMALACYSLTQLTALSMCIVLRKPKELPEKTETSADGEQRL